MSAIRNRRGAALLTVVFLMILLSLLGSAILPILSLGSRSSLDFYQNTRAFGLAQGGFNYYLRKLSNDVNWSDQSNELGVSLGDGTFDVRISGSPGASLITFEVTGYSGTSSSGQPVKSVMTATAARSSGGAKADWAVFWDGAVAKTQSPAMPLYLRETTTVNGNVWVGGSCNISSSSRVLNGIVYYASGESVYGPGTYTSQMVYPSYSVPLVNQSYYRAKLTSWEALIRATARQTAANLNITTTVDYSNLTVTASTLAVANGGVITGNNFRIRCNDLFLTGNGRINATNFTIEAYGTINTSNDNQIAGNGYLIARGDISLQYDNSDVGTLTITPNPSRLFMLSGANVLIGNNNDTPININAGAIIYSAAITPTIGLNQLLQIWNANTLISSAELYGQYRIQVNNRAVINDSFLYVPDGFNINAWPTYNSLVVTGNGTTVNRSTLVSCSLRYPGLEISSGATVSGLVIHSYVPGFIDNWGKVQNGWTKIDSATITGSVYTRRFEVPSGGYPNWWYERVRNGATVTYNASVLPAVLPAGFSYPSNGSGSGGVSLVLGSWDDH